jgi:phage terminase large subunit
VVKKESFKKITYPYWLEPLFTKKINIAVIYGGRGSGKTVGIVLFLLTKALESKKIIVCARAFKSSLEQSSYGEIKAQIDRLGLDKEFTIYHNKIVANRTKSEFNFIGVDRNPTNIKGFAKISYFWIDEGETITDPVWTVIQPTIREDDSMAIITMNPKYSYDCIYSRYIAPDAQFVTNSTYVKKVNWDQNPHFSKVLQEQRELEYKVGDMGRYNWIWEGELLESSEAQILHGRWVRQDFEEHDNVEFYYGLDFGYSVDPTAGVRCYVKDNVLYVTHEFYKTRVEIDEIGLKCERHIPGFKKAKIIADSARPETISYMKRQGYNVHACDKGSGSVEDGIAHLRSFDKIVVHPRCSNFLTECSLYSYKVDARSNDITTKIVDAHNHLIDALRYALERVMKAKKVNYSVFKNYNNYNSKLTQNYF